jgi:O-acetylhomoserine (thiol)-lyase
MDAEKWAAVRAEFAKSDLQNDGFITKEALMAVFRNLGNWSDGEFEILFAKVPQKDGRVKYEELLKFVEDGQPQVKKNTEFRGRCPANAGFGTKCLYAGQQPDPTTGARVVPICQNTGFVFKDAEDAAAKFNLQAFGPIYTRLTNPTCDALEAKIAGLEGGMAAIVVSSGHAAQMLSFSNIMNAGDNFVTTNKLYGGSLAQFGRQFKQFGWEARMFGIDDYAAMERAIDSKTKAIYCESLCNPGGFVTDMEKLAQIGHKHGLPLIVDNTSATPYLCRPFEHGADIVIHSTTKFLNGHGNAMGGAIVEKGDFDWSAGGKFPILSEPCDSYHGMKFYEVFGKDGPVAGMFGTQGKTGLTFIVGARALGLRDMGASAGIFNTFLTTTGMETLPLRMAKHCSNAMKVAEFLQKHPAVSEVTYAGLPNSKYYSLAKKYCPNGAGSLFTFSCKGGYEAGQKVVNSVKMISLIANLGDCRTLVAHPASMMHRQLQPEEQRAAGAAPEVIRLTIGLEDPEDIIADLKQALEAGTVDPASLQEFRGRCPDNAGFGTKCLYAGQQPDPTTGSRVPPIVQNTGFVFKDAEDAAAKFNLAAFGPIYTRITNPTCDALEAKIAALEGGMACITVASGHAAQMLAFSNLMNRGDNFVSSRSLYGGSITQFTRQFKQFGWEARLVAVDDYVGIEKLIDGKTKALYCESLCNPGGVMTDLQKWADIAHKKGLPLIVDNTSATPYLCRPFEWGCDIVIHSTTKFLNGHGNAMGGAIVEKGDFDWSDGNKFPILALPNEFYHGMEFYKTFGKDGPVAGMFGTQGKTGLTFVVAARTLGLRDMGACQNPVNAFLTSMGVETLPLRMERHCSNARKVAEFLKKHPKVSGVTYAGLPDSKYYKLAQQYCPRGAGSLFTFSLKGGFEAGQKVVDTVQMISLVANLGDSRTLIAHPASMMHRQLKEEEQRAAGAAPEVIRLTIGLEDPEDIINDLAQALDQC